MTREPRTVEAGTSIADFADQMLRERQTIYPVVDETGTILGVVSLPDIQSVRPVEREAFRVEEVMHDVPLIESSADAFDSLAELSQARSKAALVVDGGHIAGILSETDYAHVLTMQRGFE